MTTRTHRAEEDERLRREQEDEQPSMLDNVGQTSPFVLALEAISARPSPTQFEGDEEEVQQQTDQGFHLGF